VKPDQEQNPGGRIYVGCSGWAYASWKPGFYPAKVSAKKFLEYYATQLNSVEVNYTFRTLPGRGTVEGWLGQTGPDFRFSFKAPQRITHFQRLKDCGQVLAAFAASVEPAAAAGRLGLALFQLPPNLRADAGRLAAFLADARGLGLRIAFEFRDASWFNPEIYRLLEQHSAALCVAESDELETPDVQTAPFFCYRLRQSEYTQERLAEIQELLTRRSGLGDVFAYFKHEEEPTGALRAVAVLSGIGAAGSGERRP
jgi:uncharacterized protein YecE (DUF72 family)